MDNGVFDLLRAGVAGEDFAEVLRQAERGLAGTGGAVPGAPALAAEPGEMAVERIGITRAGAGVGSGALVEQTAGFHRVLPRSVAETPVQAFGAEFQGAGAIARQSCQLSPPSRAFGAR